jgi:ABC-type lipoprotein export system ATPase subunit
MSGKKMIECDNLVKIYKTEDIEVVALQGLDLTIEEGEVTAIIGKSGSGKSTLLNVIAGLDRPSAGSIRVAGHDLLKFNDHQLMTYNRETIGFVWQNNARNLIPYLTALQNVTVPSMITGHKNRKARALALLEMVGMGHKINSKLSQLSGGEQQRIAIAIALANDPKILLADEPTGSVDHETANHIMEVLNQLNRDLGITIIIVTHDRKVSKMVNRVISINDGMIGSEMLKMEDVPQTFDVGADPYDTSKTHNEYAIIDKKGRMRIPEDIMEQLHTEGGGKVLVHKTDKGFEVEIAESKG